MNTMFHSNGTRPLILLLILLLTFSALTHVVNSLVINASAYVPANAACIDDDDTDILSGYVQVVLSCGSDATRSASMEDLENTTQVIVDSYNFMTQVGECATKAQRVNWGQIMAAQSTTNFTVKLCGTCNGCDGSLYAPNDGSVDGGLRHHHHHRHHNRRLGQPRTEENRYLVEGPQNVIQTGLELMDVCNCETKTDPTLEKHIEPAELGVLFNTACTLTSLTDVTPIFASSDEVGCAPSGGLDEGSDSDSTPDGTDTDSTPTCPECDECESCDMNGVCQPIKNCCTDDDECPGECMECEDNKCKRQDFDDCCTSSSQCPKDEPFCVDNECIECRVNGDCDSCEECKSGDCRKIPRCCTNNSDCKPPFIKCQNNLCIECTGPGQCGGLPCNECDDGKCKKVKDCCKTKNDCPAKKPFCDAANNVCVQCKVSGDCGNGPPCDVCDGGKCKKVKDCCKTKNDCGGPKPFCDAANNVCVQCIVDNDCGTGPPCHKCQSGGKCKKVC